MQQPFDLYKRGIAYWYLFLIPLIFAGFYKTYFSVLLEPTATIIHIHFAFMMLWTALLITQPLLIRYKKQAIHRIIGKISYVIVPLLLISGYFMIQYAYNRIFNATTDYTNKGKGPLSSIEILQIAADGVRIVFVYLIWLGIFYFLSIKNRRTSSVHARYMVAASLTMIGPTVDRIIGIYFQIEKFFGVIPIEYFSYLLQDLILAGLLIYDYKKGKPTKTLWICLLIYMIGQFLYWFVEHKAFWQKFVSFVV
jgi:hypothetical protein